jgi:hypothetical protein
VTSPTTLSLSAVMTVCAYVTVCACLPWNDCMYMCMWCVCIRTYAQTHRGEGGGRLCLSAQSSLQTSLTATTAAVANMTTAFGHANNVRSSGRANLSSHMMLTGSVRHVCACIHVCLSVLGVYVRLSVCLFVYLCVFLRCVYVCVCVCVYACICVCVCLSVCLCACLHLSVCLPLIACC